MKEVKIIVRDTPSPRSLVKVGDVVEWQAGLETMRDTVRLVEGGYIEGEKFDLSGVNFTIVKS